MQRFTEVSGLVALFGLHSCLLETAFNFSDSVSIGQGYNSQLAKAQSCFANLTVHYHQHICICVYQ